MIVKLKNKASAKECDIVIINTYDSTKQELTINNPKEVIKEYIEVLKKELDNGK